MMSRLDVKEENCKQRKDGVAMGAIRNGARTFLNVIAKACQLSRIPGFHTGLNQILGATQAANLIAVWEPLCALVDTLIASDNYFNQVDRQDDDGTGEDQTPA